ncbi:phosphate acyltransferase PlsX [Candidatus Sumerlaeota bacterium]|nr:phosphate acyltransferase PlsX [Candidatus Sumerlaeota bacterium]
MSMKKIRIALDAMGGDVGPEALIEGAILALAKIKRLELVLVGKKDVLLQLLEGNGYPKDRLTIADAPDVVAMDESPKESLKKRHSSLAIAVKLVSQGVVDGLVSAGNTGATLAHTLTNWRTIKGVRRPAIAALLPTQKDAVVLIDAGANVDCRPEHLLQFAIMGSLYAQKVLSRHRPKVGLISIGEELRKGNRLTLQTQKLLADAPIHFCGNAEGRDILSGEFDVVVCDGFIGNILLKFGEATVELVLKNLRSSFKKRLHTSHTEFPIELILKDQIAKLDYAEYGGAPLLGVQGIAIISHGESNPKAIMNAIKTACDIAQHNINSHIQKAFENRETLIYAT